MRKVRCFLWLGLLAALPLGAAVRMLVGAMLVCLPTAGYLAANGVLKDWMV